MKQLNLLKKKHRNLKILLSIGGWTYSSNFAPAAATPSGRSIFATSAVSLIKDLGLDGIDIDWEYPKDSIEAANLVHLLQACREALNSYGRSLPCPHHFELTVACPAGAQNYQKMDLKGMNHLLDFWNLMAYDFAGSWDTTAGHQANLFPSRSNPASTPFSIDAAVKYYISQGIEPRKIVLGMPIYGRAFENTDGPGKPFGGTGQGTWEAGVYDFKKLPLPGAHEVHDQEAGATYCYDPAKRVMVTYDTIAMAETKAEWIRREHLGGGMWWESSADRQREGSLIGNVVRELEKGPPGMQRKDNCLEYPESKYDNLRKGFPGE
jgi:chitinase